MPFKLSDIERAAVSLIRDYGDGAADRAAESAREAREAGNATSAGLWSLIEREIKRQQSIDRRR